MKSFRMGFGFIFFTALIGILFQNGCGSNSSPASPSGNSPANTSTPLPGNTATATNSPTLTPTTTVTAIPTVSILWDGATISRINTNGTTTYQVVVGVQVNGSAFTSAGVSLAGGGATISIPYSSTVTYVGQPFANYLATASFTYVPGQTYVLSTTANGKTAAASITAPGGISYTTDSINGNAVTLSTWTNPGASNQVILQETVPSNTTLFNSGLSANSPVTLPDNGGGNLYTAGPGSAYNVYTNLSSNTSTLTNATFYNSTLLSINDTLNQAVTLPAASTSTPTGTPTNSPTATPSSSPTNTPTNSPTPTPSSTATTTPTATTSIIWDTVQFAFQDGSTVNNYANLDLQVNNQPATNVLVTLEQLPSGTPVTLVYSGYVTYSSQVYADYYFYGLSSQAGQTYVFSSTALGQTASATISAPGGLSFSSDSNGAVTLAAWTFPGSFNDVRVTESTPVNTTTFEVINTPNSPVTIPPSAYPDKPGVYQAYVQLNNFIYSISNGTLLNQAFIVDSLTQGVTFYTPTATPSPTMTFTPTMTSTPTWTSTACPNNNLGNSSPTSSNALTANILYSSLYNTANTVEVNAMEVTFSAVPGSGSARTGIYNDNGSGTAPSTRLGISDGAYGTYLGWNQLNLAGPVILAPGNFWLAYTVNSPGHTVGTSAGGSEYYAGTAFSVPTLFPAGSAVGQSDAVRADYCNCSADGNSTLFGLSTSLNSAFVWWAKYVPSGSGNVGTARFYVNSNTPGSHFVFGLYSDNAGVPGTLLSQSNVFTQPSSLPAWAVEPLNTVVPVTGGGVYWVAVLSDVNTGTAYQSTIASDHETYYQSATYPTLPSSASGPSLYVAKINLAVDLCP